MIANVIRANHRSNKTIPTVLIKNARSALSYGFMKNDISDKFQV